MKISEPVIFYQGNPTQFFAYIIRYDQNSWTAAIPGNNGFSGLKGNEFLYRLVILDISNNLLLLDKFFLKANDARFYMSTNFRRFSELHSWTHFFEPEPGPGPGQMLKEMTGMSSYWPFLQLARRGGVAMEISVVENLDLAASFAYLSKIKIEFETVFELFAVSYGRFLKKEFQSEIDAKDAFYQEFCQLFDRGFEPEWSDFYSFDFNSGFPRKRISLLKYSPLYTQAGTVTYILDTERDNSQRYRLVVYNMDTDTLLFSKYHENLEDAKLDFIKKFKNKSITPVWTDLQYPGEIEDY